MRELKERQEQQNILMLSSLPHFDQRDNVLDTYTTLLQLHNDGTTTGTILLNSRSEYARTHGEEKQEQSASIALASLLVAHMHSQRNPSYMDIAQRLGKQAAFFGMAFASACFVSGQPVTNSHLARRSAKNFPPHGLGKLNDMVRQAKMATLQALGNGSAQRLRMLLTRTNCSSSSTRYPLILPIPAGANS